MVSDRQPNMSGPGRTEMAALPDDRVAPVAAVWATAEEWRGDADPELFTALVDELRRVARAALTDGADAYCWICL